MTNISYVSLSQATALTRSMDTAAHNLANATTSGYKAIHPVTQSVPDGSGQDAINYVRESGTYLELSDGPLTQTGNPMDIAIAGDGWFFSSWWFCRFFEKTKRVCLLHQILCEGKDCLSCGLAR